MSHSALHGRVLIVVASCGLIGSLSLAAPAFAWDCQPGVPDSPENEAAGLCVLPGMPIPTPVHTATVVPTTPPTTEATSPPTTVPTSLPIVAPPVSEAPGQDHRVAVCHYETSTGRLEKRLVEADQIGSRLAQGDTLLYGDSGAVCAQPTVAVPTPMPTAPPVPPVVVVPAAAIASPTSLPPIPTPAASIPEAAGEQVPGMAETPPSTPTESIPEAAPARIVQLPVALPNTGDGSLADEVSLP